MERQPLRVEVLTWENRVGAWVAEQARRRGGIEVVSTAPEAFVVATPADEVPVPLCDAILLRGAGWRARPVALVTYGVGDGAVELLRSVFSELHVVMVGSTTAAFDSPAAAAMFEQLEWWGRALRDRRS